jgi:hypothetical protein
MPDNSNFDFPGLNIKWGQKIGGTDAAGTLPNKITITGLSGITLASGNILGNSTASAGPPTSVTLSSIIDRAIGSTQNNILQRGASSWNQVTLSSAIDNAIGSTQGSILYRNASNWVALTPGTANQVLTTNGAGANPNWANVSVSVNSITGLGSGVATFLATPTSANLANALTDETGTGAAVFATSPTLVTPNLGTPSAINCTNATSIPAGQLTGTVANARLSGAYTSAVASGGATLSATPADPSGTTSGTGVMMGLGSTCKITPASSTRVHVTFDGVAVDSQAGANSLFQVRYGTGTAPANGAALTGTSVGNLGAQIDINGNGNNMFSMTRIITGLTPGTQIWIDIGLFAAGGTASLKNLTCIAMEF